MIRPVYKMALAPLLLLILVSCLGPIIRTPKFEIKEAGLLRFDPPGLGLPAQAVIRMELEGRNPNPYGGKIEDVRFDLMLEGERVAAGITPNFELKGDNVAARIPVDVEVPITADTLKTLFRIARGEPVSYRMDGSFRLNTPIGGLKLGPFTFAQGTYRAPSGPPNPPSFAWRSDLTRLTVGAGGLVLDLGFEIKNPSPIGYRLVAPLALQIGGQTVARAEAGGSVPALGKGIINARFQIDPLAAGRAVISGQFDFQVSSAPTIEVPGLDTYLLPLSVLFGGTARK